MSVSSSWEIETQINSEVTVRRTGYLAIGSILYFQPVSSLINLISRAHMITLTELIASPSTCRNTPRIVNRSCKSTSSRIRVSATVRNQSIFRPAFFLLRISLLLCLNLSYCGTLGDEIFPPFTIICYTTGT